MKQMNKQELDELIEVSKKYWETGDKDILDRRMVLAKKISYETSGNQFNWVGWTDLIKIIDGCINLKKHISKTDIYRIFEILGFSIKEKEVEL